MIEKYIEYGYDPIPLPAGKKAEPPKGWADRKFVRDEFPKGCNVALHCSNFSILDADRKDVARRIYERLSTQAVLTTIVETKKGAHFWFAGNVPNSQDAESKIDTRGPRGYGLTVPSVVEGWEYRFVKGHGLVPVSELKPFPSEYLPKPKVITKREVDDVERYVMEIESYQGQAGSKGLIRFIAICRDGGKSEFETLVLLLEWNKTAKVNPPWSEKELERAVRNTFKKGARSA